MLALKKNLLDTVMKEFTVGVFISLTICGLVSTEICSVHNNIPISEYHNEVNSISDGKLYDINLKNYVSMNIRIKFECDTLIFNAENILSIVGIGLKNNNDHKSYTADIVSLYENGILNISFTKKIPPGSYNLYVSYKSKENLPAVLSEWLVLTNFDENNVDKKNNETIRIWIRKSALGHGKYLMENAKNLLVAFKNYTGATYNENKYVKLDLFVLPKSTTSKYHRGDFFYVDEETFVNEEYIATNNNKELFCTIAELMINQAFGNDNSYTILKYKLLILKLKQYLVYYITDKVTKNWHLMDIYPINLRFTIFEDDFIFSHSKDNRNHFSNGAFIIRMIAHIVGKSNFETIVQNYLRKRNRVKNTTFISEIIGTLGDEKEFIEKFIDSWIDNKGYPVVTIKRDYKTNRALIKQSFFSRDINFIPLIRYWVPLNFARENNPNFDNTSVTDWLDPAVETIEILAPLHNQWLICNKQQFGYYRVNYDEVNWKLIINYLKSKNYYKIHVLNRAQLIDDAFVLAEFGYLNFNIAFDLSRYLKVETEYVPWATFWEKMFRLFQYSSISSSRYWKPFKNMILELSGPLERKLLSEEASDGNDHMERLTKISFIKWTCFYGSTLCRNYSLSKLKNWLADPVQNPLLEDIRGEILCAGIRSANEETWNKLLDKFLINKDNDILHALMCSSNYELLDKLMMMFIDGQLIQINIWYFMIRIAHQSAVGLDAIINFIDKNKDIIRRKHDSYKIIENMSLTIEQLITNPQQLDKFKIILSDNFDSIGRQYVAIHMNFATSKVSKSVSVLKSMENYWKV